MTPETRLKNSICLEMSRRGYIPLRLNVFMAYTERGVPIHSGLPRGTSDLVLIQPGTGRAVFVECKVRPRRATPDQRRFIENMQKQGALAGVCYSVQEVLELTGEY